jgi:hypothetical protein
MSNNDYPCIVDGLEKGFSMYIYEQGLYPQHASCGRSILLGQDQIEVIRHARVRRKQLYYLRGLTGKAARLKELRPKTSKEMAAKEAARAAKVAEISNTSDIDSETNSSESTDE